MLLSENLELVEAAACLTMFQYTNVDQRKSQRSRHHLKSPVFIAFFVAIFSPGIQGFVCPAPGFLSGTRLRGETFGSCRQPPGVDLFIQPMQNMMGGIDRTSSPWRRPSQLGEGRRASALELSMAAAAGDKKKGNNRQVADNREARFNYEVTLIIA